MCVCEREREGEALSLSRSPTKNNAYIQADNDDITMGQCFNDVALCTHMWWGVAHTARTGGFRMQIIFLNSAVCSLCARTGHYFLS